MVSCGSQAYMSLNDIDAAVASFKKALDLEPNDGQWYFLFGILVIAYQQDFQDLFIEALC